MKVNKADIKRILLGVTGGIAAYKAAELARLLVKRGIEVKVVMTSNAEQFIHQNTFYAITHQKVHTDLFDIHSDPMMHIELAKWADLILIAPATASTIAKLAHGYADDMLSTICLATKADLVLAPAMNKVMWENSAVQHNINTLISFGYLILNPAEGEQACGDIGFGRMREPVDIINSLFSTEAHGLLKNLKILITAGPTQEAIDPVRYIGNRSSGKMGYALAKAYREAGAHVTLVSGPTAIVPPAVNQFVAVRTADEMHDAVMGHIKEQDIFIAAAAVADYKPTLSLERKIKKQDNTLMLELVKNKDILQCVSELAAPPFLVGFAAETHDMIDNARLKLIHKKLDVIVVNQIKSMVEPFGSDYNQILMMSDLADIASPLELAVDTKENLARKIMEQVHRLFVQKGKKLHENFINEHL